MPIRDLILSQEPEQALQEIKTQWIEMAGAVNDLLNHFNVDRTGLVTSDATMMRHIEMTGNPPRGTTAPTQVYLNNTSGWRMAVGDELYYNIALPDDWVPGTDIEFAAQFYSSNTTAARYVRWTLDWQATALGESIASPGSSGSIDSADILLSTTANALQEATFAVISGSSLSKTPSHDHIFFHLIRTAAVGTAPAAGDNPVIMHFDVHYTAYVTDDWAF